MFAVGTATTEHTTADEGCWGRVWKVRETVAGTDAWDERAAEHGSAGIAHASDADVYLVILLNCMFINRVMLGLGPVSTCLYFNSFKKHSLSTLLLITALSYIFDFHVNLNFICISKFLITAPAVLWCCWWGDRKGIWLVENLTRSLLCLKTRSLAKRFVDVAQWASALEN